MNIAKIKTDNHKYGIGTQSLNDLERGSHPLNTLENKSKKDILLLIEKDFFTEVIFISAIIHSRIVKKGITINLLLLIISFFKS